jgi:hypothetical protein
MGVARETPDCSSPAGQSNPEQSDSPREPVRCCVTCGAVITEGTTEMHNQWHDRLLAPAVAASIRTTLGLSPVSRLRPKWRG